jgi:hypothetical protein
MKYLFIFFFMACSQLSVKEGTLKTLADKRLIGFWTDGHRSSVKIYCEGQFDYERDYRVNNPLDNEALFHYAGAHDRDQGGRIRELKDNKIFIIPFGRSYKIDSFPSSNNERLEMIFEGKTYWLIKDLQCSTS